MKKKTLLLTGVLAMVLVVPMAHAAKGNMSISITGGMGIPISKFSDVPTSADFAANKLQGLGTKAGINGGVGFDYMVTDAVAFGVDGSFSKADGKDDLNTIMQSEANGGDPVKATGSVIEGGVHLKYMIPIQDSPMSPYLLAGGGFYSVKSKYVFDNTSISAPPTTVEATSNKFGGKFGAGVSYKASEVVGIGIEGVYNIFQFDKDELSKQLEAGIGAPPNSIDVSSASNIAVRAMVSFSLSNPSAQ
jgi:opacity protein-like surface antigen